MADEKTEEIIEEPLGDDDIRRYLPNAKIMKYSELARYNNIDELLPKDKDYAIILYEDSPNKGHWTAILKYKPYIEYFDSYGGKPDNPLNWVPTAEKIKLGANKKLLSGLLDKYSGEVVYNPTKFQGDGNDINTCGRHCVFRIKNLMDCNRNLSNYYTLMKEIKADSGNDYDEIISHFIGVI